MFLLNDQSRIPIGAQRSDCVWSNIPVVFRTPKNISLEFQWEIKKFPACDFDEIRTETLEKDTLKTNSLGTHPLDMLKKIEEWPDTAMHTGFELFFFPK